MEKAVQKSNGPKITAIKTQQRDIIVQEIIHRRRFVEEGSKWEEEVRNSDGQTELHLAALENRVDKIFKFLSEGADINAIDNNCYTPLHSSALAGTLDIALVLLQQSDIDVEKLSSDGSSILHFLVRSSPADPDQIEKLITILELVKSKGGDINAVNNDGSSCLHDAIQFNSLVGVNWLLEKKANINIGDKSPFF